jgi:cysteine-rich repeat protein
LPPGQDDGAPGLNDGVPGDGSCGNGSVQSTEECDGGGETVTCDADCTLAFCGDGTVNAVSGETCDDVGESAACDDDCTAAACGDGTLNVTAGEACDDGNTADGDGCDASCAVEMGCEEPCLLAHYEFEGDVTDSSENGYDGIVGFDDGSTGIGSYQTLSDGTQALSFDGNTLVSTGIDINGDVLPRVTLMAWVLPSVGTYNGAGMVMSHDDGSFDRTLGYFEGSFTTNNWIAFAGPDEIFIGLDDSGGGSAWRFVAVSYDHDTGDILLYVHDETSAAVQETTGATPGPSVNTLNIGNNPISSSSGNGGQEYFNGLISEAAVVEGFLTQAELDDIVQDGIAAFFASP